MMDSDENLKWQITGQEDLYQSPYGLTIVRRHAVLPNGRQDAFDLVQMNHGVKIFAVVPDGRVVTLRQFKPGAGEVIGELPGGMIGPNEKPLAAAQRELLEETGYTSARWTCLSPKPIWRNASKDSGGDYIFLAEHARRAHDPRPDKTEFAQIILYHLRDLAALTLTGGFNESNALSACYYVEKYLERRRHAHRSDAKAITVRADRHTQRSSDPER